MKKELESIKKRNFGKLEGLNTSDLTAIRGGCMAQTKTKGAKTKEATADKDSSASKENPTAEIE